MDESQTARAYLARRQIQAYRDFNRPPPTHDVDSVRRDALQGSQYWAAGGEWEGDILTIAKETGLAVESVRTRMAEMQASAQQLLGHMTPEALEAAGDTPTPHVDPRQHLILKKAFRQIALLPETFPALSFA